jgi:hypothetical protein
MSLQGQKQSLEVLGKLQARIAIKSRQLLREQHLLEAESSLLEELAEKKRYRESLLMQTHLASEATTRIKGLAQRAEQIGQVSWYLLNQELETANQRYYSRSQFIEQSLLPTDEASLGHLDATLRLKSRRQFIDALHQHERQEAILKWMCESPKNIQKWKAEQRPIIDAHIENDPERDSIIALESQPANNQDLKAAKDRYLALLGEVTLLLEEVRKLENASATSEAERDQIDRHAKAESLRLSKTYALNLFQGDSELVAYRLAAATLAGALAMHAKRLEAMREKALALEKAEIDELSAAADSVLIPEVAQGFRDRTEQALARRSLDALAQIRHELAELTSIATAPSITVAELCSSKVRGFSSELEKTLQRDCDEEADTRSRGKI